MLISKIPEGVDSVRPSRVRAFSILGSTTTATVCNTRKTGNMMLIAAGHNHIRGTGVSFGARRAVSSPAHLPRFMNSTSCLDLCGRTLHGSNRKPRFSSRLVTRCHGGSSPSLCPGAG